MLWIISETTNPIPKIDERPIESYIIHELAIFTPALSPAPSSVRTRMLRKYSILFLK